MFGSLVPSLHGPSIHPFTCILEIRDFPKGHSSYSYLLAVCVKGIKNCINLKSCTWTRDGSLHTDILESLCSDCPQLEELEINGNSGGYDPAVLLRFHKLKKISLIMPSAPVLDTLPAWLSATRTTLRSLTIVCKVWSDIFVPLVVYTNVIGFDSCNRRVPGVPVTSSD